VEENIPKPSVPTVTIAINGEERHLLFDFNALATLEEKFGGNALDPDFWRRLLENMSATTIRTLVWAGLLHEDPDLDIRAAGRLNPIEIAKLHEAIQASMGWTDKEAGDEKADPPSASPNP